MREDSFNIAKLPSGHKQHEDGRPVGHAVTPSD
jgi:hypothetical protein